MKRLTRLCHSNSSNQILLWLWFICIWGWFGPRTKTNFRWCSRQGAEGLLRKVLSLNQETFEILGDVQVVRAPGCLPVVPRPSCGRSNSNWGYASCLPAGNGIMGKQLSWLFSQHLLPTQLPGSRELPGWVSKCLLRRMRLFERSACGAVSHERVGEISLSHKVPTFQHLLAKKKKK